MNSKNILRTYLFRNLFESYKSILPLKIHQCDEKQRDTKNLYSSFQSNKNRSRYKLSLQKSSEDFNLLQFTTRPRLLRGCNHQIPPVSALWLGAVRCLVYSCSRDHGLGKNGMEKASERHRGTEVVRCRSDRKRI